MQILLRPSEENASLQAEAEKTVGAHRQIWGQDCTA
jgi:hypothetical protein